MIKLQLNTLNRNILAVHLRVDRLVFVVKSMTVQFVRVNQISLVDHRIVGQNVRQAQNVLEINLVRIHDVLIPAREFAVKMLDVV